MPPPTTYAFPLTPISPADANHSRRGEATLVELRDGRVLMAYGRFTGRNDPGYDRIAANRAQRYQGSYIERDNDFGEVAAVTLDGNGTPASAERVLVPCPPDGLNAMNPALARLPDGRIGLLYSHRISRHVSSRRFLVSADEGATWTDAVNIFDEGYVSGGHDRFNVLSGVGCSRRSTARTTGKNTICIRASPDPTMLAGRGRFSANRRAAGCLA